MGPPAGPEFDKELSMPDFRLRTRCVPLLLLLSACATAPASAPAPVAAAGEKRPEVSLICHPGATAAVFDQMGVPRNEYATDVALTPEHAYVLFTPARLVRITRKEGQVQAETTLGPPGQRWTAIDVDPMDGSLWVTSEEFELRRITPDWKVEKVPIQRVAGTGGFRDLRVAEDALYALPTCAEDGVWRIDRRGNILSSSFPAPPVDPEKLTGPLPPDALRCSYVRLDRDAEGRIVVWDSNARKLFHSDGQGGWTETDGSLYERFRAPQAESAVVRGIDVGGQEEQWLLAGGAGDLFYWKGRPVFLGSITWKSSGGNNTLLLVPEGEGGKELVESCHGHPIRAIATTGDRYAAITQRVIVFGDFTTAPDLP
jgi:hypothetical protein